MWPFSTLNRAIERAFRDIERALERIMATLADLTQKITEHNAKVDELGQAQAAAFGRVSEDFAALNTEIQALKDQIANGVDTTEAIAAVDAATAKVQASVDALNALDPVPPVPVPEG